MQSKGNTNDIDNLLTINERLMNVKVIIIFLFKFNFKILFLWLIRYLEGIIKKRTVVLKCNNY